MQTVPVRWNPAHPGRPVGRLEVWSAGQQVASVEVGDLVGGSVKDEYKLGIRRTLDVTVDPTAKWLRWAKLPGLELRPYAGYSWGQSEHVLPMGRFPVLPPSISLPAQDIHFQAADYWQWAVDADFSSRPRMRPEGASLWAAAEGLCNEFVAPTATSVTSDGSMVRVTAGIWDKTAHDAVAQCVEAFAGDAFVDRDGIARVQDHVDSYGPGLSDGDNGSIIDITTSADWASVKNSIVVSSSNDDHKFEPFELTIEDPNHPAHQSKIGLKRFGYSNPLFTERWQAVQAAYGLLPKKSSPALGWAVTALPDPSVDAGDIVAVSVSGWDPFQARIQSVTHDFGGGDMKLTLGAV